VVNEFPPIWFDTFLSPGHAAPVDRELRFIQAHLPLSGFRRLLDIPCGIGRHSGPLARLGYDVVGVDRSREAISIARKHYPDIDFRELDMFGLGAVTETFDAVLCLWQSFGYGSAEQNRELLSRFRTALRPGGRLLLDVYNKDAAELLPDSEERERAGRTVFTSRSWSQGRMRVELTYSGVPGVDVHEWEIFSPSELERIAVRAGFEARLCCAWFDETIPPSRDHLRMQFLLERG
jgi:SAM-dependent methyltransferase